MDASIASCNFFARGISSVSVTSDACDSVMPSSLIGNSSSSCSILVSRLAQKFLTIDFFSSFANCGDIEVLRKHPCNALEQFVG